MKIDNRIREALKEAVEKAGGAYRFSKQVNRSRPGAVLRNTTVRSWISGTVKSISDENWNLVAPLLGYHPAGSTEADVPPDQGESSGKAGQPPRHTEVDVRPDQGGGNVPLRNVAPAKRLLDAVINYGKTEDDIMILEFCLASCPLHVCLTDDGGVFLDAGDVAEAVCSGMNLSDFLQEYPGFREDIPGLPAVYEEAEFFRLIRSMENESGVDSFFTAYLETAVPEIRARAAMIAEDRWTESDKVRQLEQDLEMNLAERRKAEDRLTAQSAEFREVLQQFVRVCADNGAMSRLLLEIYCKTMDKTIRGRIEKTVKYGLEANGGKQ